MLTNSERPVNPEMQIIPKHCARRRNAYAITPENAHIRSVGVRTNSSLVDAPPAPFAAYPKVNHGKCG